MDIKCDFIYNGYALQISDDIEKNYISINGTVTTQPPHVE